VSASTAQLEDALRDLPRIATLVKDRGYRQVWRFEHGGRAYYLKFYPRPRGAFSRESWRRLFRGSPAYREFERLQRLQKASIPAPRAVAYLAGLRVADRLGDAVILEALEPSVQVDLYLNDLDLRGEPVPDHLKLAEQVRTLVSNLGKAKLGHEDLHLGNFLLYNGKVYLLDGYAVRTSGLVPDDIFRLAHNASRFATRTDLLRGWRLLGPTDAPMPQRNPVSNRVYRTFLERATRENRYFGLLESGDWRGVFFKHAKYPRPWSSVSRMSFSADDWRLAWPDLLSRIEADQLEVIKRSRSGDVLSGDIALGGRTISVVIKRPRRRYWYRYLNEIGRGARARRAWVKAWKMIARNVPSAWPLLLMERRRLAYVVDTVIVFERVPGPTLAKADLDEMPAARRDMLFRRVGRILRKIESFGFSHFDAKASNWIVMPDDRRGETPVLIDIDGIRQRRWVALGIQRLLKSLRSHPQYTPADSLALCQGYAPFTRMEIEREGDGVGSDGVTEEDVETLPAAPGLHSVTPSPNHPVTPSPPPPGAQ
jgi:tRNA A-37 threonylcarbamoyl transferase component Bud32